MIPHHHIAYMASTQTLLTEPCHATDCDTATRRWILALCDLDEIAFAVHGDSVPALHDYFGPF